jgi:hypothetical protein
VFLFPSDVLRPRRVDDHFAQEAEAARELGVPCALVDHNALTSGDAARGVARVPPAAEWTTRPGREEFDAARRRLGDGPAVLRDYTKSMKHYWDEAVFIPSLADGSAAWRVASRFLELGDGQVSDRPASMPAAELVAAITG